MEEVPGLILHWSMYTPRQRAGFLAVLFLVSTSQFFDRNVMSIVLEPIKHEFNASDTMLGILGGFCFALFYALAGLPVARWADRGNRRTIIAVALALWSAMTVFCGIAQTFWQLALARVGVGAGESGGIVPSQSLIVDYFPPERRASAIAILTGGSIAGNVLGLTLGGYITAMYGWRSAFLWAVILGLALVLVVRSTLAEPRLRPEYVRVSPPAERMGDTISHLWRKRSYLTGLVGCLIYFLFAYGALIFVPSFLIRVLHAPLAKVSTMYGLTGAASSLVGTLGGGWLADRLGRQDIRWLAWLPAAAFALAAPLYILGFASNDFWRFILLAFVGNILLSGGVPSAFSAIHSVCGNPRRATAFALVYFSASLFGGGFGPLVSGALSDALSAVYGPQGLRYALMLITTLLIASGSIFYVFGRQMPADLED